MSHKKRRLAAFSALTLLIFLSALLALIFLLLKSGVVPEKNPVLFGSTYMTMDNQYFEILNNHIESLLEANGDSLITRDGANSQQKQNAQILDMLDMGVKLIFISPADKMTVSPALEECEKRGVPFIAVDTALEKNDYQMLVGTIVSDNYAAGALAAQDLIKRRKKARLIVLYDKNIESTCLRLDGFLDTLNASGFPFDVMYTTSSTTLLRGTMVEAQKFLNLQLDFDAVFGANDPAALGWIAAIQNNKLWKNQLVYGVDGSPAGKRMIQQRFMQASVAQFPSEVAKEAVSAAYRFLETGERTGTVKVAVQLVTRENVDNLSLMGWQ